MSRSALVGADVRAEFRERNPQHWMKLEVDTSGQLRHLRTDDQELVGGDDFAVTGFLQTNAALLGGRAEDDDRHVAGRLALFLQDDNAQLTGVAVVRHLPGPVLDIEILRQRVSLESAIKAGIGTKHIQTLTYGVPGKPGCEPDGRGCAGKVLRTRARTVTLAADEVGASVQLGMVGGRVRLLVCVQADVEAPEAPDLLDAKVAGFPYWIDASTGSRFATDHCIPTE